VKHGLKQAIRSRLIVPPKPLVEVVDPNMRELDGMFETFKADCALTTALLQMAILSWPDLPKIEEYQNRNASHWRTGHIILHADDQG
jgi:hypothetical protein